MSRTEAVNQFDSPPSLPAILTLAVTTLVAVLPHLGVLPFWYLPLLLACVGWRLMVAAARMRPPGKLVRVVLVILIAAMVASQFGSLLGQRGATALLAGMLALKLLETQRYRDVFLAAVLLYFLAISAFLDHQGLLMLPYLFAVVCGSLCSLMLLRGQRHHATRWEPLLFSIRLVGLALIPAVLLLYLFPRLASPLWGVSQADSARTGLSDEMSPGAFSELITDDSPALRVRFPDGQRPGNNQLYWRGPVLWDYDGETWRAQEIDRRRAALPAQLRVESSALPYEVTMLPTDRRYRVLLEMPVRVPENIALTADYFALGSEPADDPITYQAASSLRYRLDADGLRDVIRQRALRLPVDFNPQTRTLAAQWRDRFSNPSDIIQQALLRFRQQDFSYTLAPPPLGRHAMDEFLFETQAGFCEHYASAFVVLMRAAGVPARVVTGYQGGEDVGDYVLIRHSNAHAWAEVWLNQRGWVRVDPTAAVSPERVENGLMSSSAAPEGWQYSPWMRALQRQWDRVQDRWSRWVVDYDDGDQRNLMERLGLESFGPTALIALLFIPLLAVMAIIGWWLLWRRQLPADELYNAYATLLKRLERRGFKVAIDESPASITERLEKTPVYTDDVDRLLRDYQQLRYMPNPSPRAINHWVQRCRRLRIKRKR